MGALCGIAVVCRRKARFDRGAEEEREFAALLPVVRLVWRQPEQHAAMFGGHEPVLWPSCVCCTAKLKQKRNARLADGVWSEMVFNEYALVLLSRFMASRLRSRCSSSCCLDGFCRLCSVLVSRVVDGALFLLNVISLAGDSMFERLNSVLCLVVLAACGEANYRLST